MIRLFAVAISLIASLSCASAQTATTINCGSTYYIPLMQVDSSGNVTALPSTVKPAVAVSNATNLTATIGTMPEATTPALAAFFMFLAAVIVITISVWLMVGAQFI